MTDKVRYRIAAKYPPYNVGETIGRDPADKRTKHLISIGVLVRADEVEGATAADLLQRAPLTGLENMTVAELKEYAADEGYDIAGLSRKAEVVAAIMEQHQSFPVSE